MRLWIIMSVAVVMYAVCIDAGTSGDNSNSKTKDGKGGKGNAFGHCKKPKDGGAEVNIKVNADLEAIADLLDAINQQPTGCGDNDDSDQTTGSGTGGGTDGNGDNGDNGQTTSTGTGGKGGGNEGDSDNTEDTKIASTERETSKETTTGTSDKQADMRRRRRR